MCLRGHGWVTSQAWPTYISYVSNIDMTDMDHFNIVLTSSLWHGSNWYCTRFVNTWFWNRKHCRLNCREICNTTSHRKHNLIRIHGQCTSSSHKKKISLKCWIKTTALVPNQHRNPAKLKCLTRWTSSNVPQANSEHFTRDITVHHTGRELAQMKHLKAVNSTDISTLPVLYTCYSTNIQFSKAIWRCWCWW